MLVLSTSSLDHFRGFGRSLDPASLFRRNEYLRPLRAGSFSAALTIQALNNPVDLSQQLLLAVKTRQPYGEYVIALAEAAEKTLAPALPTDAERKAFWINVYNAFTQIILLEEPEQYRQRRQFYATKQIRIAGQLLSLEDIEHGILRRSKVAISFGYLNKWVIPAFEKLHRVHSLDARIHFALNCGAKSCPPIRFYEPERIDEQLDLATEAYLSEMVEYREETNEVHLPRLFRWFQGDFGGKKGILRFLQHYRLVPAGTQPRLRYIDYDWNLRLDNFE